MNFFKNDILTIDNVFDLLRKPRDISKDEFNLLVFFMGITCMKNFNDSFVTSDNAFESFILSGIAESKSDVRRFMKGGSIMIGKKQITHIDQKITEDDFFKTGIDHVRWNSIKHGKKKLEFIFITEDNGEWFELESENNLII